MVTQPVPMNSAPAQPTPRPWRIDERYPGKAYCDDSTGSMVADCGPFRFVLHGHDCEANARLIVRAVNSHDELVRALEACATWFDGYAASHAAKGDTAKSNRNLERADFCRAALARVQEAQPHG